MKFYSVNPCPHFVGRVHEKEILSAVGLAHEPAIVVIYGRRRVGKTELIEQVYKERNLLKFEGVEGVSEKEQIEQCFLALARYAEEPLLAKLEIKGWLDFFSVLTRFVSKGKVTLYFEEVQWLACYQDRLVSALKYVWDNEWRRNPQLVVVLCGSSPSFMVNKILHSKALYNRSQHEIPLQELSLAETKEFLKKRSPQEVLDAYLTVGGVPEYLKWINRDSSVFLGLCKNSFVAGSFFSHEHKRIFVSSLSESKGYRAIVEFLGKRHFATRNEILARLKTQSGGTPTALLNDLVQCGFIERYTPYNLHENSTLARYSIRDAYLHFYFKFIQPLEKHIDEGLYNNQPLQVLNTTTYAQWLGLAFERFCRKNHRLIAKALGFEAVRYRSGAYFNKASQREPQGYQLDLVFERDDKVLTVCEVKYHRGPVAKKVISEFEKKIEKLSLAKKLTLHKVLITVEGAEQSVKDAGFFDRILELNDLMT